MINEAAVQYESVSEGCLNILRMYIAYSRRGIDIVHISQCVQKNEGVLVMFVAMCCFQFEYL